MRFEQCLVYLYFLMRYPHSMLFALAAEKSQFVLPAFICHIITNKE